MDKDLLMETLKELFDEERIKINFSDFENYSRKGLRLTIKLDNQVYYEDEIIQEYFES
jgi:hypothetical protein